MKEQKNHNLRLNRVQFIKFILQIQIQMNLLLTSSSLKTFLIFHWFSAPTWMKYIIKSWIKGLKRRCCITTQVQRVWFQSIIFRWSTISKIVIKYLQFRKSDLICSTKVSSRSNKRTLRREERLCSPACCRVRRLLFRIHLMMSTIIFKEKKWMTLVEKTMHLYAFPQSRCLEKPTPTHPSLEPSETSSLKNGETF